MCHVATVVAITQWLGTCTIQVIRLDVMIFRVEHSFMIIKDRNHKPVALSLVHFVDQFPNN